MIAALDETVRSAIDRARDRILALSHDLHAHPEIAWEEVRSCARVASDLADAGFTIEENFTGLPTAFLARRGTGPLHLAVCAEYDALKGMGHACGHNVIAAISTGAAVALAPYVDDLGVTLSVFGTPAEEGGGGKIEILDRGGFVGVHAAAMVHPGPVDVARAEPYAVSHSHIQYDGRAAHAAAYPDRGVNAADAFTIAQVAIGLLRQQFPHDVRVHGVMTNGGEVPNAIPQRTEGRWYVRAGTLAELAGLEQRVNRCFEAGALATGCELTITPESKPYAEFRTDEGLLAGYVRRAEELGRRFSSGSDSLMNRASTDMGNVSQHIPAIHPYIGIDSLPAVNHQVEFAAAAISAAADRAAVDGAQALALTLLDAASDPETRQRLIEAAEGDVR
ncbi:M20 family metallopeptidase [Mycolicibacterium helvum]|uniref:Peptidase M20 domain-containing protein 2 n=1 Tax=Mycolicibacterium helvum TaxID=1534349 RepID=A0A7I7T5M0_9MYCO|nr:M20 family metallopeptidase [Mycolicibacterium helvum]BBY64562.1 peptidase M20 [Mycolicibacterium helvum]